MKDKEYCITYIANTEFLEETYYYIYAKNMECALKHFRKFINQEVKEVIEIRLLGIQIMKDKEKCFICNKDITKELPKIDVNGNHYCSDCYLDKCKKELKERVECGIAYCEDTAVDEIKQDFKMQEEKRKQIEEMSKEINRILFEDCLLNGGGMCENCGCSMKETDEYDCQNWLVAKKLLEKYQPKLHKDSVVLSREEYEKLKNESIDKLFTDDTFFKEEFKANEEYLRKRANRDYIKLVKKQSSKETAEKIAKYLFSICILEDIPHCMEEYFKKQFGVEIKE